MQSCGLLTMQKRLLKHDWMSEGSSLIFNMPSKECPSDIAYNNIFPGTLILSVTIVSQSFWHERSAASYPKTRNNQSHRK